ncbi:MAG: DUF4834 domain-containing protein [Croceitalea sp.]|nr:DUF4834 domain-containing protein [Croceitalea sp.]MBT8237786.1 DUF4834 domain-containing protein [Croceitalea sp.]NNC35528.1 DUF4834 domain-containing protein [Croceitalea sp.]NNL09503.1 DUF4834 domain-containing protein [Croceitalea sp.]NNM18237.1 DUF4834 domain-containing protein [Croceitalea sp.]
MVLLQTILILIIVYYGFKLLLKWLAPKILDYAMKKTEERFGQTFGQQPSNNRDSTFVKKDRPKANPSKKVGEYIDFEEIE